jgi:hypothetical protein
MGTFREIKPMMMLHCGGESVEYNDLLSIPLPEETSTYKPVAHYDLANNVMKIGEDLLKDYSFHEAQHAITKDGKRYFAVFTYNNRDALSTRRGESEPWVNEEPLKYNIAIRNSYDKSMSIGVAMGATVFVCDNLALTGDIHIMRKHTQNVLQDLEEMLITNIYRSQNNFMDIVKDAVKFKEMRLNDDDAYEFIGLLLGHGVLRPRQVSKTLKHWKNSPYEEFEDRNAWSLYNAVTSSLKSTPPNRIMESHINLHNGMLKMVRQNAELI